MNLLPDLVAHADWSTSPTKRWIAHARRLNDSRYYLESPQPVPASAGLLSDLRSSIGERACLLIGFDFPIGLPLTYAARAGIDDFLSFLRQAGRGRWSDFYDVAELPGQVNIGRPFYPRKAGSTRQSHLVDGLGVESIDDLRRLCEKTHPGRRAACPLFWTLGAQQVGKAAIHGWWEVITPALQDNPQTTALWPFDGDLPDLLQPGRTILAETYPAEFYRSLGVHFSKPAAGARSGKRVQAERSAQSDALLTWAQEAGVVFSPVLRQDVLDGFGNSSTGEDRFDATIGLCGMLDVLLGTHQTGYPEDEKTRTIEGWILGQAPIR